MQLLTLENTLTDRKLRFGRWTWKWIRDGYCSGPNPDLQRVRNGRTWIYLQLSRRTTIFVTKPIRRNRFINSVLLRSTKFVVCRLECSNNTWTKEKERQWLLRSIMQLSCDCRPRNSCFRFHDSWLRRNWPYNWRDWINLNFREIGFDYIGTNRL